MYNIYSVAAWWSHSVTFRGCAIGSLGGSWSISCRWAAAGTLGGGCMKQSLPFHCTVRWSFLLRLGWCFKPSFKSCKLCFSGYLWLTVWLLWTTTGDTIGLLWSSSCLSGRDIVHTAWRIWCWSPLDLCIHWSLLAAKAFCWLSKLLSHCHALLFSDCMNGIMHRHIYYCHFRDESTVSLL